MGRFASTVPFYERARQPYGDSFFAAVARGVPLDRHQRLLDVGTGPGLLALGFAPFVGSVSAVDPEPAMVAAARRNAEQRGVTLDVVEGRAEDLPANMGLFDVVTVGRALHWMEPAGFRAALDRLVRKGGCVLICAASSAADGSNPWLAPYKELRDRWGADRAVVRTRERAAFFGDSRFRAHDPIEVSWQHSIAIDVLADRVLSMSSTSPDMVGAATETLRRETLALLAPFADDGGAIRETVIAKAEVFRDDGG